MAGKNINSFAENMRRTITAQTNTLNLLNSIQNAISSNDTFITYDYEQLKDGSVNTYQLPSFISLNNRLKAIENNLQNIATGKATLTLNDGTNRKITISNLPQTPAQITGIQDPSTFNIDSNWFFENLMFPGCTVNIDLTGRIDDFSDRVRVARIILNANDTNTQILWTNDIVNNSYNYNELKAILSYNDIQYSEDIQTVNLPLVSNTVQGEFQIMADPESINGNIWYTLDKITYNTIDEIGNVKAENNVLSVGDRLAYNNSLFSVVEINQNKLSVRLKIINGSAFPGVYSIFKIYQDPFRRKAVDIRFGAHEYNIIYIKGINEEYNLLSNEWSTPIKFASDQLVLASNINNTFEQFYVGNVVDWGAQWIAESKEKRISAFYGQIPNTPTLTATDFRVVQINTQINAALDTADIKNTASSIEAARSEISSIKQTIAAQKTELKDITAIDEYNKKQQEIATNTEELKIKETEYSSLVKSFQTSVQKNNAVLENPKYHIRGFFPIPLYKYRDSAQTIPEEIIGFDIAYRYICEDNTGTQLNTFNYTDTDGKTIISGTFTDWIIEQSAIKQRIWNNTTKLYEWKSENVADGSEININQIDIPISKGEKVEIKIRAISEAGYPNNPLKSSWSNTITINFPDTLNTSNAIADLVTEINDDALKIAINNNLDAIGITSHMADTIPNTNSVNGLYFNHTADNLAYEDVSEDGLTVNTISLQEKVKDLEARLKLLESYLSNQTNLIK